jgi:hypothetical protein
LRKDENSAFLIVANFSKEAISEYNIVLQDAEIAESAYSVKTDLGSGQAQGPKRRSKAFSDISHSKI